MNRMEFRGKIKRTLCHETEIVWFQFYLFANVWAMDTLKIYKKKKKLVSYRTNTILSHTSRLPGFISFFFIRLSIYLRTVRETPDSFFFGLLAKQLHKSINIKTRELREWRNEKKQKKKKTVAKQDTF